jgi:hypothetical protein
LGTPNGSLEDQWTLGGGRGIITTYQLPSDTPTQTILEFDSDKSGQLQSLCEKGNSQKVVEEVVAGHNSLALPASCTSFVFVTSDGQPATISRISSHP